MTKAASAKSWLLHSWSDGSSRSYREQADVLQWSVKDPATGKFDSYWNLAADDPAATDPTSPTDNMSQAGQFASDTRNGSLILAIAVCANDFGTGPDPAGNTILAVEDPANGGYGTMVGQVLANTNDCNCDIKVFAKFGALPLLGTSWTGSGAVSSGGVLILGSGTGTFRLGQRMNSAHMPTVSVTGGEVTAVRKLSGVLGAAGSTYQLSGGIGATTFSSEAMTTTDIVSAKRHQTTNNAGADFTDYPGLFLAEISGTDGATIHFAGALQSPAGSVANSVTTGAISSDTSSGLTLSFAFNGGVGGSPIAPAAGTGFTNSHAILAYDIGEAICTVAWARFASLAGLAATATPHGASNYAIAGIQVRDAA